MKIIHAISALIAPLRQAKLSYFQLTVMLTIDQLGDKATLYRAARVTGLPLGQIYKLFNVLEERGDLGRAPIQTASKKLNRHRYFLTKNGAKKVAHLIARAQKNIELLSA